MRLITIVTCFLTENNVGIHSDSSNNRLTKLAKTTTNNSKQQQTLFNKTVK